MLRGPIYSNLEFKVCSNEGSSPFLEEKIVTKLQDCIDEIVKNIFLKNHCRSISAKRCTKHSSTLSK